MLDRLPLYIHEGIMIFLFALSTLLKYNNVNVDCNCVSFRQF